LRFMLDELLLLLLLNFCDGKDEIVFIKLLLLLLLIANTFKGTIAITIANIISINNLRFLFIQI
jgi:hypothetical protein